jgi:ABC-type branched-subunit amino acid transport system substrate-binding protein
MLETKRWQRVAATCGVLALVASACGNGDGEPGDPYDVATGPGVTSEPCPEAVNEDNGCIYLGVLSDLTVGPFAGLGPVIVEGQRAFWQRVNEQGGIGGAFDVNIDEYTRDNEYNPQVHAQLYDEIEPNVLALAQTLGTPPTEAILPDMDADNMVGVPASWWSGWNFEESDSGVILESGYSYCIEAQIGLDWSNENEGEIGVVQTVGYPGDYGGDGAAGVEAWAEANDAEYLGFVETGPNALVGSQDAAVQQVVSGGADRVFLGVGPLEAAEIIGGAVQSGFEGRFVGSVPTWNPALMGSPAAPALEAAYTHIGPWEAFTGGSAAHEAMREVLGEGNLPTNDGFTFGWIWSYPLKALLEQGFQNGDLTREGLRAAVDGLVVDYEGALPERTFGEAGQDVRTAVISRPDAEADLGLATVETGVTGPTADAYAYDTRCSGA